MKIRTKITFIECLVIATTIFIILGMIAAVCGIIWLVMHFHDHLTTTATVFGIL